MRYSEANEKVKKLSSHLSFKANEDDHSIGLCSDGKEIVGIYASSSNTVDAFYTLNAIEMFDYRAIKLLVELHETPAAERADEKKYYIKVASIDGGLYLNYVKEEKIFTFSTKNEIATHQTQFTKQEVNSWLKSTTLAIDWNKALEEVPRDEVRDD